jgi:hypothetical protein
LVLKSEIIYEVRGQKAVGVLGEEGQDKIQFSVKRKEFE